MDRLSRRQRSRFVEEGGLFDPTADPVKQPGTGDDASLEAPRISEVPNLAGWQPAGRGEADVRSGGMRKRHIDASWDEKVTPPIRGEFSRYRKLINQAPELLALMEQLRPYRSASLGSRKFDPHRALKKAIDGANSFVGLARARVRPASYEALSVLDMTARVVSMEVDASRMRLDNNYAFRGNPPDLGDGATIALWRELAFTQFGGRPGAAFEGFREMPIEIRRLHDKILFGGIEKLISIARVGEEASGGVHGFSDRANALELAADLARRAVQDTTFAGNLEEKLQVYERVGRFTVHQHAAGALLWQPVDAARARLEANIIQEIEGLCDAAEENPRFRNQGAYVLAAEFIREKSDRADLDQRLSALGF